MLPKVSMLNQLPSWIQVIYNWVRKIFFSSCEYSDFKVLVSKLQTFFCIWSNWEVSNCDNFASFRIINRKIDIWLKILIILSIILIIIDPLILLNMYKSFIKIKNQEFFKSFLLKLKINLLLGTQWLIIFIVLHQLLD